MRPDATFPLGQLNELARLESYNKHYYRPANYIHKWWARRLGSVFRTILLAAFLDGGEGLWDRYYRGADFGGKIVLDPFMGGGTTVVEALRLGCKVIGVDLNPVAWWTVKKAVEPVDLRDLDEAFGAIEAAVADRIKGLYKTTCAKCHRQADVVFILWVKGAPCPICGERVPLHASYVIARTSDDATVHCPSCHHVFSSRRTKGSVECPGCGLEFDPSRGPVTGSVFTCPSCRQRHSPLEAARASGQVLGQEMFALRYDCPVHGEGFKGIDREDKQLYQEAVALFRAQEEGLIFPRQAIPNGLKTGDLLNHSYRFWHELFNERQLLCLDVLLRAILDLDDENVREFMLTLFSSCLEFNNMFSSYKGGLPSKPGAVRHIFSHHAFVLPREPLENNLWGVERTSGTFSSLYQSRLRRGKAFCLRPVERLVRDGRVVRKVPIWGERIEGRLAATIADLRGGDRNALLLCQDSSTLDLPDGSVDAVITDPPYFDNVQYSELADFFYVWLRLYLRDKYAAFEPELTPKGDEVVKNVRREKDSTSFLEGLTGVFRECHRVLKDNGLFAFTFHHKESEAWAIVLKSVLDAGFAVSATYPVHAEMPISVHIHNQEAMEYDAVIFCRKRSETGAIQWHDLEAKISETAQETQRQLLEANGQVSTMDTAVVVMGKCLEHYSSFYPNVFLDGRQVSVEEAVARMQEVIDTISMDEAGVQATSASQQPTPTQPRLL